VTIIDSYASWPDPGVRLPARSSTPVVTMSAPTHPSRPQHTSVSGPPADAPTIWIAPTPPDSYRPGSPGTGRRLVLPARSPVGTAFDLVARLGTAVTLAALLVVTATALGVVDGEPMPTGAATTGR
jgi:hypothetical protein